MVEQSWENMAIDSSKKRNGMRDVMAKKKAEYLTVIQLIQWTVVAERALNGHLRYTKIFSENSITFLQP